MFIHRCAQMEGETPLRMCGKDGTYHQGLHFLFRAGQAVGPRQDRSVRRGGRTGSTTATAAVADTRSTIVGQRNRAGTAIIERHFQFTRRPPAFTGDHFQIIGGLVGSHGAGGLVANLDLNRPLFLLFRHFDKCQCSIYARLFRQGDFLLGIVHRQML
jgi:hypothetical protein